ncbi:MAG: peptidylprolyl isomerase, partial [Blastocatellia bacterium]
HRDFASLARQYSEAPNAEQGGLNYYEEGQLPDVLERAIKVLQPGEISPVIQSNYGFHIFKLERRTQPHTSDDRRAQLDAGRSQLIEEAIERKNQEAVDAAVASLVSSSAIVIKDSALGFTYSGALRHN